MKKILIALVLVGVLGIGSLVMRAPATASANTYTATNIQTATTSAQFAVTSSTRVLATTTNALGNGSSYTRVYATICNPSSNPVYLNLNGDRKAGTSTATTVIAAASGYSACFEITDRNQYQGSVTASSTSETSTNVSVSDYVQQ